MLLIMEPAPIQRLRTHLTSAGFTVEETAPGAFGNYVIDASRGGLLIRAVRDRGEWRVELAVPVPDEEWVLVEIWRACMEGRTPSVDELSLSEEVSWLVDNLDELHARIRDDRGHLIDGLFECREERGRLMRAKLFGEDA